MASSTIPGNGQGSAATAGQPRRNRSSGAVIEPGEFGAGVQRTLRAIVCATVGDSIPHATGVAAGVCGVPIATFGEASGTARRARLAGVRTGSGCTTRTHGPVASSSKARRCGARCAQSASKRQSHLLSQWYQRFSSSDQCCRNLPRSPGLSEARAASAPWCANTQSRNADNSASINVTLFFGGISYAGVRVGGHSRSELGPGGCGSVLSVVIFIITTNGTLHKSCKSGHALYPFTYTHLFSVN